MMASLTVRKNVDALTAPELQALREAYKNAQQIMDNRGYNYYAGLHGIPIGTAGITREPPARP
jgi:hypothetical protein